MSNNTPTGGQEPQEWPTYPGGTGDPAGAPGQPSGPAANPTQNYGATPGYGQQSGTNYGQEPDEAYEAYQSYQQQSYGQAQDHQQLGPYPDPYQNQRQRPFGGLDQKWLWIIGGIIASFVLVGVARSGNWWSLVIFAGIAWWLWSRRNTR